MVAWDITTDYGRALLLVKRLISIEALESQITAIDVEKQAENKLKTQEQKSITCHLYKWPLDNAMSSA